MPNGSKSKIYMSGVEEEEKYRLCSTLGFHVGSLPVKYLGVPLITTRIKHDDCKELIGKVLNKVKSWTSKCLSYAGRLVLVKHVLYSIQVYWSQHFILPKSVVEAIEQILRRYLWTGAELKKWGSKVAWSEVCLPTEEGGLGIKNLQVWNQASMLRHLWAICTNRPSLWVQWCKANLIKGKCFWMLKSPTDSSWTWRKILSLRSEALKMSKYKVGNGKSISLWFSNWHPLGLLIPRYGERVAYDAGINKQARVSQVIEHEKWKWPYPTTWELREIVNKLPTDYTPNPRLEDEFIWQVSKDKTYNTKATWNLIRPKAPKVRWYALLWFPNHIPRHSFILWLAIRGKLNTKDKIEGWGIQVDSNCVLCGASREDMDHLFFRCSFSAEARKSILSKCSISKAVQPWQEEVNWAIGRFSKRDIGSTIGKLAWSALIYHLWKERNSRLFKDSHSSVEDIVQYVRKDVKAKLSFSFVHDRVGCNDVSRIRQTWGIP